MKRQSKLDKQWKRFKKFERRVNELPIEKRRAFLEGLEKVTEGHCTVEEFKADIEARFGGQS